MALTDDNIVNEKFWLNLATENIYNSFEKRTASVKNIKTLIEWAFGLFVSTGFIIGLFGKINEFPMESLIAFGIAFLFFTIAYALATQASYPVTTTFIPNDTEDIARAYSVGVKKQSHDFKRAARITATGFFCLSFGIMLLFFNAKKPPEKIVVKMNKYPMLVNAGIEKTNEGFSMPMVISTDSNSVVSITISSVTNGKDSILYNAPHKTDTSGRIHFSCPLVEKPDTFLLKAGRTIKVGTDTTEERFMTLRLIKKKS